MNLKIWKHESIGFSRIILEYKKFYRCVSEISELP